MLHLEDLWAALLSQDEALIKQALAGLKAKEAGAVRQHLRRMATEEGYSEAQRKGAKKALEVIGPAE